MQQGLSAEGQKPSQTPPGTISARTHALQLKRVQVGVPTTQRAVADNTRSPQIKGSIGLVLLLMHQVPLCLRIEAKADTARSWLGKDSHSAAEAGSGVDSILWNEQATGLQPCLASQLQQMPEHRSTNPDA